MKTKNHEIIFRRNSNLFKSFWDLQKNLIKMWTPKYPFAIYGTLLILFLLSPFLTLPFIVENPTELLFMVRLTILLYLIVLFFAPFSYFFHYINLLKFSPIFQIVGLKLNGEKGFWIFYKTGKEEFIHYKDIILINYQPYFIRMIASSRISYALAWSFYFSKHFLVRYRGVTGEEKEIQIPLNINKIQEALSEIISHIPEEKRGNTRVINGKVTASLSGKTSFLGLNIDLDTPRGKFILVILFLIVIGIWFFMMFYLRGK